MSDPTKPVARTSFLDRRWLRFEHEERVQYGLLEAETVQPGHGDPFTQWTPAGGPLLLASVSLLTPCQPSKLIGLWNELVSRLSREMTLEPGDVITCGTSLGPLPMRPGAHVEIEIAGIGILSNCFVAEPEEAA
jgi:hypothetical protein